MKPLRNYF